MGPCDRQPCCHPWACETVSPRPRQENPRTWAIRNHTKLHRLLLLLCLAAGCSIYKGTVTVHSNLSQLNPLTRCNSSSLSFWRVPSAGLEACWGWSCFSSPVVVTSCIVSATGDPSHGILDRHPLTICWPSQQCAPSPENKHYVCRVDGKGSKAEI